MNETVNRRFAPHDDGPVSHLHAGEHPTARCRSVVRSSVRNNMHESRQPHGANVQGDTLEHDQQAIGLRLLAGSGHAVDRRGVGWIATALEAVDDAVAARDWEYAEALIEHLKSVCEAGSRTPPVAISSPSRQPGPGDGGELLLEPLRARELEVLSLVAAGYSNQDIAEPLIVSVGTVRWHLKNIYSKLDVHSRTQAVACVRATGLLN